MNCRGEGCSSIRRGGGGGGRRDLPTCYHHHYQHVYLRDACRAREKSERCLCSAQCGIGNTKFE